MISSSGGVRSGKLFVDLSGHVAFEDPDDLFGAASLVAALLDIGSGTGIARHAGDNDPIQH